MEIEKLDLEKQSPEMLELAAFCLTYDKNQLAEKAKGTVMIRYGNYPYEVFNVCFLHDMLSQILEVLRKGYIPKVELAGRKKGWCDWADYFEQPFFEYGPEAFSNLPVYEMNGRIRTMWGPEYEVFRQEWCFEMACKLYRDWVVFNGETLQYIQKEYYNLIQGKNVLGVLCRGTDFVTLKPAGHPVQPGINDLIAETRKMKDELGCEYIYVASEEKKLVETMKEAFPGCILENQRHYCDEEYYQLAKNGQNVYVSEALYSGETDYRQRGLEYLSSLMLLSVCRGLVAGDCGGSECALYLNDRAYEKWHIFSLGRY